MTRRLLDAAAAVTTGRSAQVVSLMREQGLTEQQAQNYIRGLEILAMPSGGGAHECRDEDISPFNPMPAPPDEWFHEAAAELGMGTNMLPSNRYGARP